MTIEELIYILKTMSPSSILRTCEKELFDLIPELQECKGCDQHSEWHIYDVYEHILHVVDGVESNEILRMSALFHDIGKPKTLEIDKYGIGHFPEHEFKSKEIFEEFAENHSYDENKKKTISKLIRFHDTKFNMLEENEVKKIINKFTKEELIMLYKLKRADIKAQSKKAKNLFREYDKQEKRLLLLKKGNKKNGK